jgi:hypothetical protein
MFYDMWHRATGSSLPDDIDVPVGERDPAQTRWMSKFRFWRMEVSISTRAFRHSATSLSGL